MRSPQLFQGCGDAFEKVERREVASISLSAMCAVSGDAGAGVQGRRVGWGSGTDPSLLWISACLSTSEVAACPTPMCEVP